jgi:hypothetical protein
MSTQASAESRNYLYAIISGAEDRAYGPVGINNGNVYTIAEGRVEAVISDVPNGKIRPERRHLAAHQDILARLMKDSTPLPVSFGIIGDGHKAIRKILSRNQGAFIAQLQRVAGRVEMGLRVAWDVPNIFEYLVNTSTELRQARDLLLSDHGEPTQEDKIEIGHLFDRILNEDRNAYTDQVKAILSRHCSEIKTNKCRTEREVMNLACLVKNEAQPEFESDVFKAAALFDNNFAFDYNGPWAPHNFVDINLKP